MEGGCAIMGFAVGAVVTALFVLIVIYTSTPEAHFHETPYVVSSIEQVTTEEELCHVTTIKKSDNSNIKYFIFVDSCKLYKLSDTIEIQARR